MVTRNNLPHSKPQDQVRHPAPWEQDLNPNRGAGERPGSVQPRTRPASELKRLTRALDGFTMDELAQIPVIEPGSRLAVGSVYIDLQDRERREFQVHGETVASAETAYVPKSEVPYPLWNRLRAGGGNVPSKDDPRRETAEGDNELHGGRERAERRGAEATGPAAGSRRH
jgi:hypothetical protein